MSDNIRVAVHAIQTTDADGKVVDIAPGTVFTPKGDDLAFFDEVGAVREATETELLVHAQIASAAAAQAPAEEPAADPAPAPKATRGRQAAAPAADTPAADPTPPAADTPPADAADLANLG